MSPRPRRILCAAALVASVWSPALAAQETAPAPAAVPLFNGRDLSGWVNVNGAPGTWTVSDGLIACTGKPTGVLRTDRMYENFVLELDWRHLTAGGNSGLFIWSDALPARGQPFTRAIEVQIMDGVETKDYTSQGDVFSIHGAHLTPDRPHPSGWERCLPSEKRTRPSPEWNHYRVICRDGTLKLEVNGAEVSGGSAITPRKGYICLESEGSPVNFRNISIAELPSSQDTTGHPLPADQVAAPDTGFRSLYDGVDLAGWKPVETAAAGARAGDATSGNAHAGPSGAEATEAHWHANDWVLESDGQGGGLSTLADFGDVEISFDWKSAENTKDISAVWSEMQGLPAEAALNASRRAVLLPINDPRLPAGEWKRMHVTVIGDSRTFELEGKVAPLAEWHTPGFARRGPLVLEHGGIPVSLANIFVRELDKHPAVLPVPNPDAKDRTAEVLRRGHEHPDARLVFLGDSITEGWEGNGRATWERLYAPRGTLDLGVGGDQTANVLWRFQQGQLDGLHPAVVVLMLGTNNIGNPHHDPAAAAYGMRRVVDELRTRLPDARVLLLGVFPRDPSPGDDKRRAVADLTRRLAPLADGEHVVFLDIGAAFLETDGTLAPRIMPDFLHLSPEGYERWAAAMEPTLRGLLGE